MPGRVGGGVGPGRPEAPPIRLTRRGRVVLVTAVLVLVVTALWLGAQVAVSLSLG